MVGRRVEEGAAGARSGRHVMLTLSTFSQSCKICSLVITTLRIVA